MLTMKEAAKLLQKPHGLKVGDMVRVKCSNHPIGIVLSIHKDKTYPDIDRYYMKYSLLNDPTDIRTQWVGNMTLVSR